MDFWDGFHIDDAYFEKDKFFEAKTNIKRKRILSYFGLPDSEGRIVYYKDTGIMIVFLDYWDYNSKIDLWENGKVLHLRGTKEYDLENDINLLNVKDNALYFLDRNDIAVHLFWAEEKDKYGHVMVPQNRPYQIQELSENGTIKFVWIFPLLPVDVSYKMEDKYSFYGANKIKGYRKKFIKKQAEEIERNDIEDTLMIKDISNITFNLNLRDFENTSERPKPKVRAVFQNKGMSGKPLTTVIPYGYKKNEAEPAHWLIDEEAAEVVRKIFRLCVEGYGPTQIANILFSEGIKTPTEHWQAQGRNTSALPAIPNKWAARTVADILERLEYCGHTVNFRSTTRSFKDKTKIHRPKEEWKVFENTHESIIDSETWELVQELRIHKRRPNRTGEISIFSGLLYCADCEEKLYYSVTNNYSREQAYFFCSNYRKNTANCTAHYIREKVVHALVLESLRRVLFYVHAFEKQFVQEQLDKSSEEQRKEIAKKRRELAKSEKRIVELDVLFQRIYEDNVSGKLSDERFVTMSANYETEQKTLKESLVQLKADIEMQNDKTANVSEFVEKVRRYTEIKELTPAIVNEFID